MFFSIGSGKQKIFGMGPIYQKEHKVKIRILIPIILSLSAVACSHGGGGSNQSWIDGIAGRVRHHDSACPANLTGRYCSGENDSKSGNQSQNCFDIYLLKFGDSLNYTQDRRQFIAVDGVVRKATINGQTYKGLAYCKNKTLSILAQTSDGKAQLVLRLSQDGMQLHVNGKASGNLYLIDKPGTYTREYTPSNGTLAPYGK